MDLPVIVQIASYLLVGVSLIGALLMLYRRTCQYTPTALDNSITNKKNILYIIAAVILSRVLFLVLALLVRELMLSLQGEAMERLLIRWDANHYIRIASEGYSADTSDNQHLLIVFYPLFPFLIRLLSFSGLKPSVAAMVISWLSLCGAALVIYRMTCRQYSIDHGRRAVKYLLIFPAAVFLGLPFTESLFLLLSALCLLMLMERRWALAGIFGGLSALTRNMGLLLIVPFFVEVLMAHDLVGKGAVAHLKKHYKKAIGAMLLSFPIMLGGFIYLWINYKVYGDALRFITIQKEHWQQGLSTPWRAYLGTLNAAVNYFVEDARDHLWIPQAVMMTLVYLVLPFGVKKLRLSWAIYLIIYVIFAFSPSWLLSGIRYLMGLVVVYPVLARFSERRWVDVLLTLVLVLWCVYLAVGFYGGHTVM